MVLGQCRSDMDDKHDKREHLIVRSKMVSSVRDEETGSGGLGVQGEERGEAGRAGVLSKD